ncbi:hypothetical protein [Aeromicrobium terrae]|uniref:Uncharacterized protein n=1 Tax=Aeromicrobium terrae TaxID=2498846 RepID=A0A5C8NL96_9ACTN|nr:hypothetical protein [Aeromicrobium terrae]TXL62018.1 hypothetical protein FHP06_04715 [Aeromicrobium terrae]
MTTNTDLRLMPAQNPTKPTPSTATDDGKGVKAVAIFESRRVRGKRAWDDTSEIDRAVLLERVRQRRKAQARKRAVINERNGMWFSR